MAVEAVGVVRRDVGAGRAEFRFTADRVTASLDRRWADIVIDHLDQAAHNGTAVLAASHNPHLIERGATLLTLD